MSSETLQSNARRFADAIVPLASAETTTETSYYSAIRSFLAEILAFRELPHEVRAGTSERRAGGGRDQPDLAIYDGDGTFLSVPVEVKPPGTSLATLARSTDRDDQIGRYLAQTGVVILTNVHSFALLAVRGGVRRAQGVPVPPADREILEVADLWNDADALAEGHPIPLAAIRKLAGLVEAATTEFAPIAEPATLARVLAVQARRAKADLPQRFDAVQGLLEDYGVALGLTFEGDEGLEFFRSSLVQTAFYGLFAGWALWHRENDRTAFTWERLDRYLRIPFLGKLFYEFRHPDRLEELHLAPHLDRATQTLMRVDRSAFFERFRMPGILDEAVETADVSATAITYFYEPFLEAFDPDLRKQLGVWYTPPEIVRYQVGKIDRLLREELGCPRGFADESVVVLDPCCGTGAYLIEVLRSIASQLHSEGEKGALAGQLLEAACRRIVGFEILTAPFVIAQLQLYLILADLGVVPGKNERPAVFLTNSLTGWDGPEQVKLNFPELQSEHDAAKHVKRDARIIVILGNPPYNRFAGAAVKEEADLVDHYKGIVRNEKGKQVGQSRLFTRWGIRKHLLDDLYIRFIRLAEKRIGEAAEYGVVSFISNSSFLTGRSHPLMRESLLTSFHSIWADNLNGDKYRTGKLIPAGLPGEGTADQSIFTTEHDPRGIQVGTTITTYLKHRAATTRPEETNVGYREFWGRAAAKRGALVGSLGMDGWSPTRRRQAVERPEGPRAYDAVAPTEANRWMFAPRDVEAGFEAWPALDELFPTYFMGVHTGKDAATVALTMDELKERFTAYLDPTVPDEDIAERCPALMQPANEFVDPTAFRKGVQRDTELRESDRLVKGYLYRPLDERRIWYDTKRRVFDAGRRRWSGALIQRYGEEFKVAIEGPNEFLIAVAQPRRVSETRPLIARSLVDLHVHDRGSTCFPRVARTSGSAENTLFVGVQRRDDRANLAEAAWEAFHTRWGLRGSLEARAAVKLVGQLHRVAMAIIHSPQYELDHADGLAQDWAHLPIPRDRTTFERIAEVGDDVATLLDPTRPADAVVRRVLADGGRTLGVLLSVDGRAIRERDLVVSISYFGASKGRWIARELSEDEPAHAAWEDGTGDLFLNDEVYFSHVPSSVWRFELGGYPVIKKWLGYRQANRRGGEPLSMGEARQVRSMIQRIAALLALHPTLDALYAEAAADSFTAAELGVR